MPSPALFHVNLGPRSFRSLSRSILVLCPPPSHDPRAFHRPHAPPSTATATPFLSSFSPRPHQALFLHPLPPRRHPARTPYRSGRRHRLLPLFLFAGAGRVCYSRSSRSLSLTSSSVASFSAIKTRATFVNNLCYLWILYHSTSRGSVVVSQALLSCCEL